MLDDHARPPPRRIGHRKRCVHNVGSLPTWLRSPCHGHVLKRSNCRDGRPSMAICTRCGKMPRPASAPIKGRWLGALLDPEPAAHAARARHSPRNPKFLTSPVVRFTPTCSLAPSRPSDSWHTTKTEIQPGEARADASTLVRLAETMILRSSSKPKHPTDRARIGDGLSAR